MSLPRKGRYEIFSTGGRTYCFDDPGWENYLKTDPAMFDWIRSQDPELWSAMKSEPDSNVAFYLDPELYLLWKLKWT